MLLNARSISPAATSTVKWKIPFIQDHIIDDLGRPPVPILAITESWLKPYISDAQIAVDGYNSLRADRQSRKGGGCVLYVENSLLVSDTVNFSDKHCSMLYCFIDTMNALVSVIYRPPDAPLGSFKAVMDQVQEKLNNLTSENRSPDIYIMGDFNLPNIDWDSCQALPGQPICDQQACSELIDFMERNFLTQMICKPTRNNNTIDLVFTNKPQDTVETNISECQLSDHRLVELVLGHNPLCPKEHTPISFDRNSFRATDFHRADFEAMNNCLEAVNWISLRELCYEDEDGSAFLELIRLTVLQITLLNSPSKDPTGTGPSSPRRSRQVREKYKMKRKRRKLNAQISALTQNNPTSRKIEKLKTEVNLLTFEISELVIKQLNEKEAKAASTIKTNPRFFYSYAKRFAKVKSSVAPIRDINGTLKMDPAEKAEILQTQYVKVFSNPNSANVEECLTGLDPHPKEDLNTFTFTADDISDAIKELDPYASTPDGDIPAKILTKCRKTIAEPIYLLWKSSFDNGVIPSGMKTQYITPVFKKGDRTSAANYRPVSITSHIIKIFERVVRKHLVEHMESNAAFSPPISMDSARKEAA